MVVVGIYGPSPGSAGRGDPGGRGREDEDEDEDDNSESSRAVRPFRLAVVVLAIFPLIGFMLYMAAQPLLRRKPSPISAQDTKGQTFPAVPFRTQTDRPMGRKEVEAWLNDEPEPQGDRYAQLADVGQRPSEHDEKARVQLKPGELYDEGTGRTIRAEERRNKRRARVRPVSSDDGSKVRGPSVKTSGGPVAAAGGRSFGTFFGQPGPGKGAPKAVGAYEQGRVQNQEVFARTQRKPPSSRAPRSSPLAIGDRFDVVLHSGLSSVARDNAVLVKVPKAVLQEGRMVVPAHTIIRGEIRTYGEHRFFIAFGQYTVDGRRYAFEGRAEQRNYAGLLAQRREATMQERQRSTVINGVVSGLAEVSGVAAQALPVGARAATQVIGQETQRNTIENNRVKDGFVLEAPKGQRFQVLVTR